MAIVRTEDEIRRAHDRLVAVVTKEVNLEMSQDDIDLLTCSLDVLCWLLGHDHSQAFTNNLNKLAAEIQRRGYREIELPEPMTTEQWRARN